LFSKLAVDLIGKPVFSGLNERLFEFIRQALDIEYKARFGDGADNSYCRFKLFESIEGLGGCIGA